MYPSDQDNAPEEESSEDQKNRPEGQTALIDKNVFPKEPKPGDVCSFRVVKVNDDEVELEYEPEDSEEESEKSGKTPSSMDEAMSKMDTMARDSNQ